MSARWKNLGRLLFSGGGAQPSGLDDPLGAAVTDDAASGPPTNLGAREVDPEARFPPGVAILDVSAIVASDGERFVLQGTCCCDLLPRTDTPRQQRPPAVDLAELISPDTGESPARTFLRLISWSSTKMELQDWLRRLRIAHGDALTVIVRDTTDFAIPWELFWLPDSGSATGGWLGSHAILTRWTAMERAAAELRQLPSPARVADGDVLAYVANGVMANDLDTLRRLHAKTVDSLWDLLEKLRNAGEPLSLVYVACHGDFSEVSAQFVLDREVTVADVDMGGFTRLADSGPLVFVNACHSARLIDDPEYNDATLRGFAEAFLRSGAAGYIGATGAIDNDQARLFLQELTELLRAQPDRPIAAAVRDLRRRYAVLTPPRSNDKAAARDLLPFFYTFMYAYYGSPDTLVRLPDARAVSAP